MPSRVQILTDKGLIRPPEFVRSNTMYETLMGSVCYGVSTDTSDEDIYGFCIPNRDVIFPHLAGAIEGFGRHKKRFEQYQQHHIDDKDSGKLCDITIFNIVKFFTLVMENNPNCLESCFTPANCVLHITKVGQMVRENRKMFLHKGCWFKLKGFAFSQLHKASTKNPDPGSKRAKTREQYGMDVKFLYHVVRLLYEAEMILQEHDLDLQRNREHLKAIRRGEVSEEEIRRWAADKETYLEKLYETSTLPYGPDEPKIRNLLIDCLTEHYGNLEKCVVNVDAAVTALRQINEIIQRNQALLG